MWFFYHSGGLSWKFFESKICRVLALFFFREACESWLCVFSWWKLRSWSSYSSVMSSQAIRSPLLHTVNLILGLPSWQVTGRVSPGKLKRQTLYPLMENQPDKCHFYHPQNCPVRNEWLYFEFFPAWRNLFSIQLFLGVVTKEGTQYYWESFHSNAKFSKFTHSRIPSRLPCLGQSVQMGTYREILRTQSRTINCSRPL